MKADIPSVTASSELVVKLDGLIHGTVEPSEFVKLVAQEASRYMRSDANAFHARVIGACLAISARRITPQGLYARKMLEITWDAGYSESPPPSGLPLGVDAAYEFALCLVSQERTRPAVVKTAEELLGHLRQEFPQPGAGLFAAGDIG